MKKKILYIAAIIICLSILTGGTLAYFTAEDTGHNIITTNSVKIDVLTQQSKNGALEKDDNASIHIMPGTSVSRVVSAQSLEADAWVRMRYELLVYDAEDKQMDIPKEELERIIIINSDEEHWIEQEGWWYCKEAVGNEMPTAPLFDTIEFSGPDMGNEYQGGTVKLVVYAQGVQKANNRETVLEAAGWPE